MVGSDLTDRSVFRFTSVGQGPTDSNRTVRGPTDRSDGTTDRSDGFEHIKLWSVRGRPDTCPLDVNRTRPVRGLSADSRRTGDGQSADSPLDLNRALETQ